MKANSRLILSQTAPRRWTQKKVLPGGVQIVHGAFGAKGVVKTLAEYGRHLEPSVRRYGIRKHRQD